MSADNWTQCPRCYITNHAKADEKDASVRGQYGKVSEDQFLRLRDEAISFRKALFDSQFCETLREDYEIGIQDGEFDIFYRGHCDTCGFNFSYKYNQKAVPEAK
jgi:hypothetical protein